MTLHLIPSPETPCGTIEQISFTMDQFTPVNATESFYCQHNAIGLLCLSASEFLSASFQDICPSGNCISDCADPNYLYTDVSQKYPGRNILNNVANQPLYSICLAVANISRSLDNDIVPAVQATELRPYFDVKSDRELETVSSTTTRCLISTCDQSRYSDSCTSACSPTTLLINNTTPSLLGVRTCLKSLCTSGGLPFANQDIAGIGVGSARFQSYLSPLLGLWLTVSARSRYLTLYSLSCVSYCGSASSFQTQSTP